jgi:phosphate/sulfate permease
MRNIRWLRIVLGALVSFAFGVLTLGLLAGILIAFSPANSLVEVQAMPRFAFVTSVMIALGCAWGAYAVLRGVTIRTTLHGALVGALSFFVISGDVISHLYTLLMAIPAGVVGSRLALGGKHP